MQTITVNKNDSEQRLDKLLTKCVRGLPVSLMYKYLRKKRIKLNGKRASGSDTVHEGDVVELYIPDEFSCGGINFRNAPVTRPRLDILYEDENILLIAKAPGQLVHDGDGDDGGNTLIRHVTGYLYLRGEYDPEKENSFSPALCNRIDRNTGGIVIAAKNAESLRDMNETIRSGGVDKRYLCAVHGNPKPDSAVVKAYLFKNSVTKKVSVSAEHIRGSREIKTGYRSIDYNRQHSLSLLEIQLYTGRTHQIRAHMAYLGYPLLGEGKYGINKDDRKLSYSHQALYAYKLIFTGAVGSLDYLNGRVFCTGEENIRFLEFFDPSKYSELFI